MNVFVCNKTDLGGLDFILGPDSNFFIGIDGN